MGHSMRGVSRSKSIVLGASLISLALVSSAVVPVSAFASSSGYTNTYAATSHNVSENESNHSKDNDHGKNKAEDKSDNDSHKSKIKDSHTVVFHENAKSEHKNHAEDKDDNEKADHRDSDGKDGKKSTAIHSPGRGSGAPVVALSSPTAATQVAQTPAMQTPSVLPDTGAGDMLALLLSAIGGIAVALRRRFASIA